MLLFYKRDKSSRYALLKLLLHTQVYIHKILQFLLMLNKIMSESESESDNRVTDRQATLLCQ